MQGRSFTFRIPPALDACLPKRLADLEIDATSAYFISLMCFDLAIGKPHHVTGDIHKLTGPERDNIFQEVSEAYTTGESLGGSWFEARVAAATKEAGLPEPPPLSKVGKNLRKRLAEKRAKSQQ